jgi:hypothetical protein
VAGLEWDFFNAIIVSVTKGKVSASKTNERAFRGQCLGMAISVGQGAFSKHQILNRY